jgi:hypothetical protein
MMTLRRMKEEKLALRRARRGGSTLGVDYLSLIDRSKLHYKRSDVTPIFAEPAAFAALVDDLLAPWRSEKIDRVVGTDALGFVVGTAMALKLGVGFVPVRKGGKLPVANGRNGGRPSQFHWPRQRWHRLVSQADLPTDRPGCRGVAHRPRTPRPARRDARSDRG